jgi:dienelactone hydrolase
MMLEHTFQALLQMGLALAATFPPPSGPYNTSLTAHQLTDNTRFDPYAPTRQPRSLMISIFRPQTCVAVPTPYMDSITAAWADSQFAQYGIQSGTFGSLELLTCPPDPASKPKPRHPHLTEIRNEPKKSTKYPLVLFSPGQGDPRLYYSAMAQEVASKGYVVVTIDHPYDAGIVVFPDNSTVLEANITNDDQILDALNVRAKDVSFVLTQFTLDSVLHSLLREGCEIDVTKVGIFGHSLGGATAASAMLADPRFKGGVNLDGSFFGPLSSSTFSASITKPFMIFAHEGKNTTTDASWAAIWPKLKGWKRMLELKGSTHGTFTDLPDVVDVLGLSGMLPPEVGEMLGSIDGERAMSVIPTYVSAFFNFVLKGKKVGLLDGPIKKFPEVAFVEPDE